MTELPPTVANAFRQRLQAPRESEIIVLAIVRKLTAEPTVDRLCIALSRDGVDAHPVVDRCCWKLCLVAPRP